MLRNIGIIFQGTAIAQVIGFLALPIFARLFGAEAFGNLQLFQALLTIGIVLPSLRYDLALFASKDDEVDVLVSMCLAANVLVTTLLLLIAYGGLFLPVPLVADMVPIPLWLVIAAISIAGLAQVFSILALRGKIFRTNAVAKILQSLTYLGTGSAIGLFRVSPIGIIIADVCGRLMLLATLWWRTLALWNFRLAVPEVRTIASKYRRFPTYTLPGGIINSLGAVLTPIMIYVTFSAATAGQYGLIDRSLAIPVALISQSIAQVYNSELGQAINEGRDGRGSFLQILKWLALGGIAPVLVVVVFGPAAIALVFGEEWRLAGQMSQILAPAFFFLLLSGALNMTLTLAGAQRLQTAWEVGRLASMIALWLAVPYLSLPVLTVVALHAGVLSFFSIVFLVLSWHRLSRMAGTGTARPIV